ncbi:MAG: hypothetical protein RMK74_17515, partial [Myxococcales bacterium]|nr:hypothetical protein [Myxococcales bacterium]
MIMMAIAEICANLTLVAHRGFTERLNSFARLGRDLEEQLQAARPEGELAEAIAKAHKENPWFEERWVRMALQSIAYFLRAEHLEKWASLTPQSFREKDRHSTVA